MGLTGKQHVDIVKLITSVSQEKGTKLPHKFKGPGTRGK